MDYEIQYKKRSENLVVDALSRVNLSHSNVDSGHFLSSITIVQPKWIQQVTTSYEGDKEVLEIISKVLLKDESVEEFQYIQGVLKKETKIYIGKSGDIRKELIKVLHQSF